MSVLKIENRTPRTLEEMQDYMSDDKKVMPNGTFGIGVNPSAPAYEMKLVQDIYHKEALTHEYVQMIFAFDVDIELEPQKIREICQRIAAVLVLDERQVYAAIHQDTKKIHCHFMINYVGVNGDLYRQGHYVNYYKQCVNNILLEYELNPIK